MFANPAIASIHAGNASPSSKKRILWDPFPPDTESTRASHRRRRRKVLFSSSTNFFAKMLKFYKFWRIFYL
uniref:Uncharacterized protein n=1 Tax=Lutzomyia longipalpis TaxID=7200 RepID=A0A1B0GIS8_LUTLO